MKAQTRKRNTKPAMVGQLCQRLPHKMQEPFTGKEKTRGKRVEVRGTDSEAERGPISRPGIALGSVCSRCVKTDEGRAEQAKKT